MAVAGTADHVDLVAGGEGGGVERPERVVERAGRVSGGPLRPVPDVDEQDAVGPVGSGDGIDAGKRLVRWIAGR